MKISINANVLHPLLLGLLFVVASIAEAACPVPKADMRASEVLIQAVPGAAAGEVNIIMSWPSDVAMYACCIRTSDASRQWQTALGTQIPRGILSLLDFSTGFTPPGVSVALTDAERAICQTMADRILAAAPAPIPPAVPAVYIIVAPISGQTTRPLYNDGFVAIGRVEFLLNAAPRVCEPTPVYKPGSTIKYYWVTNNAGQRGLAVCKPG